MKRTLSLFTATLLSMALLAGCGSGGSAASPTPAATTPAASQGAPASEAPAPEAPADNTAAEASDTPLADVRVRQALAYAIDLETIVDTLFAGKAAVANSMTSPGEWLAAGIDTYDYDPEKAKALLAEANWPSDYTLDVVYYYADQQTVDLMTVIGQYWSDVGVKAQFRKLEGDLAAQLWVPPADRVNGPSAVAWDIAYGAVAALVEHEFYDRFSSTASNNSSLPKQDGWDELLAATSVTTSIPDQISAFHNVQTEFSKNLYALPLYHQVAFIYTSDKIDIAGSKFGNDQFSYNKDILNWTTTREDKTLYTNGGPLEFFEAPHVNPGYYIYQEMLFDRLIGADEALNPTDGQLAESYSISDDEKSIEFVIRDAATWHDGQAVTAEDVKFTIELLLKTPGTNSVCTSTLSAISGAEDFVGGSADTISGVVVDGNKVTINFDNVAANLLPTFSQWPILPKHLLENVNPETLQQDAFWQNPVGSGPFKVGEVVLNNYSTLERWDGYYGTGTGNLEKIYMFASGENDPNLVKNVGGGQIDYAWSKSTDDAEAIEKMDGMTVDTVNIRYSRLFYFNQFPHEANIK